MRQEYLVYAELTDAQREAIPLPGLAASNNELALFWGAIDMIRGEQPDSAALPTSDGALRGDVPLPVTERSEV